MRWLISILLLFFLTGCADFGYYWHSVSGHWSVMSKRVDIDQLLEDDLIDAGLRERLLLVKKIRRFSVEQLALPDNDSYLSYAELETTYVIQNLFAAKEFSTRLHSWCYPIVGCAGYRGYYDEQRLQNYIAELEREGFETHVGQVAAYSTLGWFDDPVLSSFINWPESRLAGLLFHELSHQRIYIDDDTTFNESLASAVQQAGTRLWLQSTGQAGEIEAFQRWLVYRGQVIDLIESIRNGLTQLYQSDLAAASMRERKAALFQQAREDHQVIALQHRIKRGFNPWFAAELNNAKIGSISAYNSMLPAFIAMIDTFNYNFDLFFRYAEKLGKLDKLSRDDCIEAWKNGAPESNRNCPAFTS